tara:strand:- start:11 stop:550 length:540 start_codon:yes stop_codon:yes gene_type:complete
MKSYLFLFLIAISPVLSAQERWVLDSEKSLITYEASHFLHDWVGTNQNIKGVLIEGESFFDKIAIAMYVRDFDSKNSNRDNNALEILEVLQFPKIEFFSDEIEKTDQQLKFSGSLNFHGIELNQKLNTNYYQKQNQLVLKGDLNLTLSDFEVPLPSFMLRKMEDEIKLNYELHFQKLDR